MAPKTLARFNLIYAILFAVLAVLLFFYSRQSQEFAVLATQGPSVAETLYSTQRYDLLRDSAVSCNKEFNKVVAAAMGVRAEAYSDAAMLAGLALLFFAANFLSLRRSKGAP